MSVFEKIASSVARAPLRYLILIAISIAPAVYLSSKLAFDGSFFALLPEKEQPVIDLHRGIARTGGSAYALIAVGATDRSAAERYADAVAPALEKLPSVRYVEARRDLDFVRTRALLYLAPERLRQIVDELAEEIDLRTVDAAGLGLGLEEEEETKTSTIPVIDLERMIEEEMKKAELPTYPYSIGNDGRYLYIFVALAGDAGNIPGARRAQNALEETALAVKKSGGFSDELEIRFSGANVVRLADDAQLRKDLSKASVASFFAVIGLLVFYTRRIRTLIILAFPLLAGITWTFAFAWVAVGRLNIISGFLATILSGLGVEFGIHLLLRYIEGRRQGESIENAQRQSIVMTGRSLLGSGLTNAAAFFVVAFAGFKGFSELGVIAGVGVLITLVLTLFGFPAINLVLERWKPMRVDPLPPREEQGIHVGKVPRAAILIAMPLMVVLSISYLAQGKPRFHTNWRSLRGENPEVEFDQYISKSLGSGMTQTMILVDNNDHLPLVEKLVDEHLKSRKERSLPTGIRATLSLDDLVPRRQEEKISLLAELKRELLRIPRDRLDANGTKQLEHALELVEVQPFSLADVPRSLKQRMLTKDGEGSLFLLRTTYRFYESDELITWAREIDELRASLVKNGLDTPIISENWVTGRIFTVIIADGPFILIGTVLVVFLVVLFDFRRISHALLVMAAVLTGHVSLAGVMAMLGLELNFINIAVVPIIVGVSIDNAIHILHRYLEEGPASIPLVLRHTVSSTTLSSATNLMGFGALIIANHGGLRSVAILAIIGVALTYVSTSIFFPLVLQWWGERQPAKPLINGRR